MCVSWGNAIMQICSLCTYNHTDRHKALLASLNILKFCDSYEILLQQDE